MAASSVAAFASTGSVKSTPTVLSSGNAFKTSSVIQLAQIRPAVRIVQRLVSTTVCLSEEHNMTRRDVLTNTLGAGASLAFAGQALAANPGSLARQRRVEKPEPKAKEKPEELKSSAVESAIPSPSPPPEVPSAPVEPNLPEVSRLEELPEVSRQEEPITPPDISSVSEVPIIPEPPNVPEVPSPTPEASAPKAEAPNYDDFSLGDYFKDLF